MKNAKDIITLLREQKVKLSYKEVDDTIEVISLSDKLTPSQIDLIRNNKENLISYFKSERRVEAIPKAPTMKSYPLTDAQMGIWTACKLAGASGFYNMPYSIELNGAYDISFLNKAMSLVLERHEILRTVFKEDDKGKVQQYILPLTTLDFQLVHFDVKDEANADKYIESHIREDALKHFNLERGPLIRVKLFQKATNAYVLYFNIHHLIGDDWSINVLKNDFFEYYRALVQLKDAKLEPLSIQFKDYANWMQQRLENATYNLDKNYWMEQFSGEIPVLELPIQKTRPVVLSQNGKSLKTLLPKALLLKSNQFQKKHGGSLLTTLLTTLNTLLYRYTGAEEIIIGLPVSNRSQSTLTNQIGLYVNTLALKNSVSGEQNVEALYFQVKNTLELAIQHKDYSFYNLIADSGVHVDQSRSPIFDISLTMHDVVENPSNFQPINAENGILDAGFTASKNEMQFHFQERSNGIEFSIIFNTDIYESPSIKRLMNHFSQMMDALISNPQSSVALLDYLSKGEKSMLVSTFNENHFPNSEETILDLFSEQVQKTPDKVAIIFQEKKLTYAELNTLSNQFARCLLEKTAIKDETIVGVLLEKNEILIVTLLGILKAGAAYLPIDPTYPEARIEAIVNDSEISLLITEINLILEINFYENEVFTVDADFEPDTYDANALTTTIRPSQLAYVIYTSGSTGAPKGVLLEHAGITNLALNQIRQLEMNEDDVILQFASISFDAFGWELYASLIAGSCVIITTPNVIGDASALVNLINDEAVTLVTLPPSYIIMLQEYKFPTLRNIISAGEVLYPNLITYFSEKGLDIINAYGPTENTVCTTMTRDPLLDENTVVIGKPLSNVGVLILDNKGQLCPIGVVGELCFSGAQLARGYLNDPILTNEKFIENTTHPLINERLFRSGDLGKWHSNGSIEFIGRKDNQIKIRGFRIELDEIEQFILSHANVTQAVVEVKEFAGMKSIVAYVLSKGILDKKGLLEELAKKLPNYMLPNLIIDLESIPLTINGKIDNNKLPEITQDDFIKEKYLAPSNDLEEQLVTIWEEILNIKEIGILNDFFHLGGQSLKLMRLKNEYHEVFGVKTDINDLFENSTIQKTASYIKFLQQQQENIDSENLNEIEL